MTLVLIRHGETALNRARVMQPADTPLNELGHAQAAAVAQRAASMGAAGLLASDLPRALQTAQAIAAATGLPLSSSALLHERNFGDLRGRAWDSLDHDPIHSPLAPPNGESLAEFDARVDRAFALILATQQRLGGRLLVVSHGLVIARILLRHASLGAGQSAPQRLGNTSLSIIAAAAPHVAQLLDCTRHLEQAVGDAAKGLSGG